jgi:transposase
LNQKNNTLKDQVLENKCSTLQDIACNACQARQIELEQTKKEVFILRDRIKVLEALCKRNSSNSSKPPSSDGLKKKNAIPGSQRGKSGKKPGGQKGHRGSTLKPVLKPDSTIQHTLSQCSCGFDLAAIPADKTKACQIFDIPKIEIQVTEHQMESKVCPCCGTRGWSQPPTGVKGVSAAEYGPQIKSFGLDLLMHHFVPSRRVREILGGICGHSISIGSLMNWSKEIFSVLEPFESTLKENLIEAGVVHFDETGMRCQGKLHWLHSASTKDLTYYGIHTRRGMEAMKAFGILPRFKGVAVHDHWSSYFTFSKCLHSLCNSHILRELKFLAEELNEK